MPTTYESPSSAPAPFTASAPKKQPRDRATSGSIWLDLLCLLVLAIVLLPKIITPDFAPDSWSYFELSKSVFSDFYKTNTVRQFQFEPPYGTSFPPLYPILIAVTRLVVDAGVYTGMFLNAAFAVATLFSLKRLAGALSLPIWTGNILMLLLLASFDYDDEITGAGSFPLALLLLSIALTSLVNSANTGKPRAFWLGLTAGLFCLARFDMLLVAGALGVISWLFIGGWSWKSTLCYYATFALVLAPWIAYSQTHFGKPLVSDNSRTVLSVDRTYVMDYFPSGKNPETLLDRPLPWIKNLFLQRLPPVIGAALSVIYNYFPVMLLGGVLLGLALAGNRPDCKTLWQSAEGQALIAFGLALSLQIIAVWLTGYRDRRYFIPITWYGTVVSLYLILRTPSVAPWFARLKIAGTLCLALLTVGFYVREVSFKPLMGEILWRLDPKLLGEEQFAALTAELENTAKEPRLLNVSGDLNPFQFGALTGKTTIPKPSNLDEHNATSFIEHYGVTHILDADNWLIDKLPGTMKKEKLSTPGLWRVK
ncbi:MAG: hypothetical protein SGJ20_10690 [Planctomycetota bacterium]|nr:hypothetical protein [Planctomycetota bacterium]